MTLPDGRMLNILLVEDDAVDVMNVRRAFERNRIINPLHVAPNGVGFLRHLRTDPHLNLIPVVVLTTSTDEKDRVEAYNLNVAGYLVKPVTFVDFAEVMATLNKYWSLVEFP